MSAEPLFVLKSTTGLAKLLGGAVYFVRISRNGRRTNWAVDKAKATAKTRHQWDSLRGQFREQLRGRLVKAPE